jgi:hypothetical protein
MLMQQPSRKHMHERGSLQLWCNYTFIVPDPSPYSFPERATIAARKQARKEHLMLDVFMVALGLGFFLVAVGYAYACERRL